MTKKVADLFKGTKKVVADYKAKAEELDQQEAELKAELEALQAEMTANLLDQEGANLSERIYLKAQAKEVNSRTDIVNVMLEELAEERTALKLSYVPVYQEALAKDRKDAGRFDATEIAIKHRYEMLTEIADLANSMRSQYNAVSSDIYEVFEDSTVKENYPRLEYSFNEEQYRPSLSWFDNSVVSKNEAFSAVRGNLPHFLQKPEGAK